jgi:hypothetical protein
MKKLIMDTMRYASLFKIYLSFNFVSFIPKCQGLRIPRNDLDVYDIHKSSLDIINCSHDLA